MRTCPIRSRALFLRSMEPLLSFKEVSKAYRSAQTLVKALDTISLQVEYGERCAIVGPSGSGKSTMLALAAGLDLATSGEVRLGGENLALLSQERRAKLRLELVGFVFQSFQLIPTLTALENIAVPAELRGREARSEARALLEVVGLSARAEHYPSQLSGGEQQRVALARAFINKPKLILADEPTGSLDRENAERALDYFERLNQEYGSALLLVTHDSELSKRMSRIITLRHGELAP